MPSLPIWPRHAMLPALAGPWQFERQISDMARMQGTAQFRWQGTDQLHYEEQGCVTLASGSTHQARQSYLYGPHPEGFSVWFAETPLRLFHCIALGDALQGEATHACGADQYQSRYVFHPGGGFTVTHTVRGPRKDYVSTTRFQRPPAG